MSFWGELKRRNVFKVGAAYGIVAWLLVQIANTFFPILHLPDWAVTLVAALLILGFPVAVILAWAYELTPDGVKLTQKVPLPESITHVTGRKLNYVLLGVIVLAVAYILFDNLYLDRRVIVETEVATVANQEVPPVADVEEAQKTIAVLPFSDLSPEKNQEYFVDGLSEELLNCLAKINGLRVTSRTSSFAFKNTNKTLQEIAGVLGVDHILEGSVRKAGDALRITAQLIRVKDDSHLWSETYNRELKDIFEVQEDIALTVANELKVKLGAGKTSRQLGGTENAEAYEYYLTAKGIVGQGSAHDFTWTIKEQELIDSAIALDPEFALAWIWRARIHNYWSLVKPVRFASGELEIALNSVLTAVELEPDLAAGYFWLGNIKSARGDFIEGEKAIRKGIELTTEPFSESPMSILGHYLPAGHLAKAFEIIDESRSADPLNQDIRNLYISLLALTGKTQQAEAEYKRIRALVGENQWDNDSITEVRVGTKSIRSHDEILSSDPVCSAVKGHFDSPEEALAELKRLFADEDITYWDLRSISMWGAYFGGPDFAMDALEKGAEISAASVNCIWWPVMNEVRQLPRFKKFVREIGLVDYWEQFGWPDICQPTSDGDFVCD